MKRKFQSTNNHFFATVTYVGTVAITVDLGTTMRFTLNENDKLSKLFEKGPITAASETNKG